MVSTQPAAAAAGTIGIGGDLTVNRMGFGAMRITGRGIWGEPPSRDRAIATLRRVVDLGINFIDTADSYGPFVSEELIAEALYPYPDELVIATKGGLARPGPNRWNPDGRPKHLREACEGSLRRLRLEQIPLWQFHRPDPKVPLAESMGVIAELKDEGKIRHVGISNVSEAQFREAERIVPIVSIQNRFNVTDRESQPLIDLCEQEDMVFLPWAPIQQAGRRAAVAVAAERRGATERQIVLAWLLAISPAIVPIPGTGSPEHAEENVAATAIELSRDEIEAISKGGLSGRTDLKLAGAGCQRPAGRADGGLPPGSGAATCSTIRAARTLTLTLARWDARRSRSNASSGPHRCWAIKMPLACSTTGMLSSLASSRANAESCRISGRDRSFWIASRVASRRARACSNRMAWASNSRRAASSRVMWSRGESPGPGSIRRRYPVPDPARRACGRAGWTSAGCCSCWRGEGSSGAVGHLHQQQ